MNIAVNTGKKNTNKRYLHYLIFRTATVEFESNGRFPTRNSYEKRVVARKTKAESDLTAAFDRDECLHRNRWEIVVFAVDPWHAKEPVGVKEFYERQRRSIVASLDEIYLQSTVIMYGEGSRFL